MMKTTLDVPEKTYQAFRELAQQMGRSEAEIMREALEAYLQDHQQAQPALCSVGVVAVPDVHGADSEDWLEQHWHPS
ncbi:MAG TPA: CopG family transcriptional regulator [Thermomicrobiales bacterium]|nr:CopG family transcriptional regulator [Thermomicrobiales bacterium]